VSAGAQQRRSAGTANREALKATLDGVYESFNAPESAADPVEIVRRFADPGDREIVAFLASALAFGRVASVLASIERVLAAMGSSPAAFVRRFDAPLDGEVLQPLVHRWTRGPDLVALVLVLRGMLHAHGSLDRAFAAGHDPAAVDIRDGLEAFAAAACRTDVREAYGRRLPARPGFWYFFTKPSGGSGCKRLNLFLRWMVRCDAVDPGGWTSVRPAQLIVPLDTHIVRLGRCLQLTRYTSPGWKMAAEITASLRALDPIDPIRYDFALCHLGMMHACGFGKPQGDRQCPLRGWCRPRQKGAVAQKRRSSEAQK
jgi:uncharacterized protein (TIGR02757 family)